MVEYRQFQSDDAEQCRTLTLSCVADFEAVSPGGHEKLREKIRDYPYGACLGSMFCIVATDEGTVVGMGALDGDSIKRMYVGPERRGEGIGKGIYEKIEAEARRRGLASLELEASLNAVGFYRGMGYSRVREKVCDLGGATMTNVVMTKEL